MVTILFRTKLFSGFHGMFQNDVVHIPGVVGDFEYDEVTKRLRGWNGHPFVP